MRGINISEVFCEVLSGLAIMVSLIAILDVIGTSSIGNTVELFSSNFDVSTLGGLIFLAYVMGLLMDAVGLVIGDLFLDSLARRRNSFRTSNDAVLEACFRACPRISRYTMGVY